jgi:competence ComEA-like helix-hairpin-helix protein
MRKFSKKKIKLFSLGKGKLIAVALIVIAILFSAHTSLAKVELNKFELEMIKTKLNIPTIPELSQLGDEKLIELLSEEIDPKNLPGLTYGVYSLLVFQEVDFVDWIVSQRYKQDFYEYFDKIVDERTNLERFWVNLGKDVSIILEKTPSGPISALSLSTFLITNKILGIGGVIVRIAEERVCDGLWEYFDARRQGESHDDAWYWATGRMAWMPQTEDIKKYYLPRIVNNGVNKLEPWFGQLWDKWGEYIEPGGVKEIAKQKAKEEIKTALLSGLETHKFVKEEAKPSLLEKAKLSWQNLVKEVEKIKNLVGNAAQNVKNILSHLNPFKAAVAPGPERLAEELKSRLEEIKEVEEETTALKEEISEIKPSGVISQPEPKQLTLEEIQERLDDIAERIDVINQEVAKLVATFQLVSKKAEGEETKEEIKEEEEKEIKKSKENTCWVNINTASAEELQKITGIGPVLAQRIIETRPFYSLSDLIRVNGIGEATLQKIIAQGCAYVSGFNSGGGTSGGGTGGNAPSTPVSYPKILISEIQVSPTGERFIELYNPNDQNVDLTGWYIQRKTKTGTTWTSLVSSTKFEGKSVQPQSHFLIARSSTFNPEILLENLTLTENNVILIKNPNREIVDKVGWGEAQDYETAPASNPPTGQSIGRKWSGASGNYIDTDNNQNDFEIQTPTPKTKNQSPGPEPEPGEEEQNQPPIASFVFSPQNPFVGEEIIFDAASSTDDGLIVSYIWDFGDGNSTTTSQATTTYTYTSPSVDGVFSVTLQVVDNQGVKSLPKITSISVIEPTLANHIVISEIQIEGETVKDEFIELYNPTDQPIDLMGWKLTRKTSGGTENTILSNETKIKFEGIIPPKSYFLITHPDSKFKPIADVVHSGSQSLAKDNALILYDSSDNVVDKVGWGEIQDFEKAPFPQNPGKEKSLNRRKWQDFYVDNDDNSIDFEIKDPTPTNSNGETKFKSIWRGKTGEDNVNTLILANGSLFAGLNTNPGKIIKIGPETLITQTIFTTPFSSDGVHSLFFDFENNFLYTGTKSPAKILKINPETMEIIETVWEGVFPDESVNALISDGKYLYAGLTSSLATIIKLDLETKQTISWQKGPSGVVRDLIFDGQYLYAGLTGQGGLYKIEPEKMETEKYWEEAAVEF